MKVVAILGGLGSQMQKYAMYLKIKKTCSNEECMIDTTPFHALKMWNGYELEELFGIKAPDLFETYTPEEQHESALRPYRLSAQQKMKSLCEGKDVYRNNRGVEIKYGTEYSIVVRLRQKIKGLVDKYWYCLVLHDDRHIDSYAEDYLRTDANIYFDEFNHTSDLYFAEVKDEILSVFRFPDFDTEENQLAAQAMLDENSVALHARRGDHMYDNAELYERQYYRKCMDLIRKSNKDLAVYVFSDDLDWCMRNPEQLGIHSEDKVVYVDWNKGKDSYRDMQLMTYCKHNILAISSFSWWGCYLSKNTEGKIACAPEGYWFDIENHF